MPRPEKTYERVLFGQADANIGFEDLRRLLLDLGLSARTKGSHHIFTKAGINEIINIQSKGNKAKAYQVRQVRNIILKYSLRLEDE